MCNETNRRAIIATGLVCGYAATAVQRTCGPADLFQTLRVRIRFLAANGSLDKHEKLKDFLKELIDCGWCISPYLALAVYPLARKALNAPKQSLPESLVGFSSATALTAFLRHLADMY